MSVAVREGDTATPKESSNGSDESLLGLVHALQNEGYAFTTVTPATHAKVLAREPGRRASSLRDVFGWSLPFDDGVVPPGLFELMRQAGILKRSDDGWRSAIRVSSLDGGLFVHSAYPPSDEDVVFFGPDTIRFADAVKTHLAARKGAVNRAVDVGTGSGAAGIVVAKHAPSAEVVLVDINPRALLLAGLNARLAGADRAVLARSNLLSAVEGEFDLIVSNPPFMIDRAGRTYRDGGGALGEGLSLSVVEAAASRLAPGGTLVLFTGAVIVNGEDPFRKAATAACASAGLAWSYREVDPDAYGEELEGPAYATADRIALVVLTAIRGQSA
jgi:SAM-dependent methyltransferase